MISTHICESPKLGTAEGRLCLRAASDFCCKMRDWVEEVGMQFLFISLPSVGPWWKDHLHKWLRYPEGTSLFEGLGGKFEVTRAGHREMEVK